MSIKSAASHSTLNSLPNINLNYSPVQQPGETLPEEWTLPGVHKMEKREPFDTWYTDIQANILSCARQINALLAAYPHPNANLSGEDLSRSETIITEESKRVLQPVYERKQSFEPAALQDLPRGEEIREWRGLQ